MKRVRYLLCAFALIAGSEITAGNTTDLLKTTGKIVAGGVAGAAGSIAFQHLSPDASLAGIGAIGLGVTLLATRIATMVDINKLGHAGALPVIGAEMAEANWFNVLGIAVAATTYGLYRHGHKLTNLLASLADTLNK